MQLKNFHFYGLAGMVLQAVYVHCECTNPRCGNTGWRLYNAVGNADESHPDAIRYFLHHDGRIGDPPPVGLAGQVKWTGYLVHDLELLGSLADTPGITEERRRKWLDFMDTPEAQRTITFV